MTVLRRNRWLRFVAAFVLTLGFSGALSAYEATFEDCIVDCGGGCQIFADNCNDCQESSPSECRITWDEEGCENAWCSAGCADCRPIIEG